MNVYFISGLGADKRAFERLKLPETFSIHFLDWIAPLKDETLNEYALRLAEPIDRTKPFSLVGLSMGGMLAAALTPIIHPYKTVLISSVTCANEFPPLFKVARLTKMYKFIPTQILRKPNPIAHWLFGARSKNEKELMDYIISNSDPRFIKWAIGAIVNWKVHERKENLYHIHGSDDKILPIQYTHPDMVIQKGSHFMVWTKAGEISKAVASALA